MMQRATVSLAALLILSACSGGDREPEAAETTQAVAESSAVAPMDHSAHAGMAGAAGDSAQAPGATMDHANMPRMDHAAAGHPPAAAPGSAAPAAHAGHTAPVGGPAAVDHAAAGHVPATTAGRAAAPAMPASHAGMPGMGQGASAPAAAARPVDHAAHAPPAAARPTSTGSPRGTAADPATAKLLALGRELVEDSVVQRRIAEDPALRDAWSDPEVRRILTEGP